MKLQIYQPTESGKLNQAFGVNAAYYAKFGLAGHDGLDYFAPHATPYYAPVSGRASYHYDSHGGDGIYITTEPFDYKTSECQFIVIAWHLCSKSDPKFKPLIPTDGSSVFVTPGQLLGYTDNSGAPYESSGDHLHFGLIPMEMNGQPVEAGNGFEGRIDPSPYIVGIWAGNIPSTPEPPVPVPLPPNPTPPEISAWLKAWTAVITWLQNILIKRS